jgi:S-(hydroxymethyl)glutathione dehydrogenase / alcohol dehydrogenase
MKTRAALFHAVGEPLEVVELHLDDPRPHEVVVRMTAVGICGTDLHQVKGEFRRPTPMVLGHEGAGVVEEVGDAVTSLRVGDEVVLSWAPSCGVCAGCRRGRPATCKPLNAAIPNGTLPDGTTGMSYRGATVYRGTATGCLAERVVVTEQVALPLRAAVPLDQAALLGCAVLTGVGAVLYAAHVTPGASVLVIGAGGVGQFVVQGARIAGAGAIVACDPVPARLDAARIAGATHVAVPDDLRELLRAELPDGADFAFDAVGYPETVETALRSTRDGGTTVIVGLPPQGLRLDLDPFELIRKEKRLTGTLYGSEDPAVSLPAMLEHVQAGRLELAGSLGPSFPLDRVDDAVNASLAGEAGRVIVVP